MTVGAPCGPLAIPCPLSCVAALVEAVVETVRVVVSKEGVEGVKVRITVQEAAGARVPPFAQVPPVTAKSAGVPVALVKKGVENVRVPVPVFATVAVCVAEGEPTVVSAKVTGVGKSEMVKVAAKPVPEAVAEAVAFTEPNVTAIERAPTVVGVKVKTSVQLSPGFKTVVPGIQVVAPVGVKSEVFPVSLKTVKVSVVFPEFRSVIV